LDNPGWSIQISIQETELQDQEFQEVIIERSENNWVHCRTNNGFFEASGGPLNLPEMLQIFRDWAEKIMKNA